jgi:hypothetical protein
LELAARLTVHYSDSKEKNTLVKYGKKLSNSIMVKDIKNEEINKLRLTFFS